MGQKYSRTETNMKAIWKETILAESDDTVVVDGNHYFPASTINADFFTPSDTHTTCPWKGEASYYNIEVDGEVNHDAAWYYPATRAAAREIEGRVAFWRGVRVVT